MTPHALHVQALILPFAPLACLDFTYQHRNIVCLARKTAFVLLVQQIMHLFVLVASLDIS